MKLIIAGSRTITDIEVLHKAIDKFDLGGKFDEVVEGGARGVDRLARELAKNFGIRYTTFNADWEGQGKKAGYLRNQKMAAYGDVLLAVWDGESKGTSHMIDIMREAKKPTFIYNIKTNT